MTGELSEGREEGNCEVMKQTEVFTLLCNIAFASGGQPHHHYADAGVLHLDTAPISLGSHSRVQSCVEDARSRRNKSCESRERRRKDD